MRLIRDEHPTHLLIARDGRRSDGFRRQIDPSYKAHRSDTDPEIERQFALSYQAIELLGWPALAVEGYEADDVLASAATSFPGPVVIVSGDKDLLACCSERVRVSLLRPGGVRECHGDEAAEIFGVRADRIRDYKALVGDASDGIKGVEGIGPKRALALLGAYDSLQGLLAALASGEEIEAPGVTKSVVAKLQAGVEAARTSYELAGLVDDLEIDVEALVCPQPATEATHGAQLEALGLRGLRSQLPGAKSEGKKAPMSLADTFAAAVAGES
jgi:DNA polymerase-1